MNECMNVLKFLSFSWLFSTHSLCSFVQRGISVYGQLVIGWRNFIWAGSGTLRK